MTISDATIDIDDALSARSTSSIDRKSTRSKSRSKSPARQPSSKAFQRSKSPLPDQSLHPHWEAKSEIRGHNITSRSNKSRPRSRSVSPAPVAKNRSAALNDRSQLAADQTEHSSTFLSNLAGRIQGRISTPHVERLRRVQKEKNRRSSSSSSDSHWMIETASDRGRRASTISSVSHRILEAAPARGPRASTLGIQHVHVPHVGVHPIPNVEVHPIPRIHSQDYDEVSTCSTINYYSVDS